MKWFILNLVIGSIASVGVLFFFKTAHLVSKIVPIDGIKALGSFFTQKEENAYLPGLIIHIGIGIIFSFIYTLIFQAIPMRTASYKIFVYSALGIGLGLNHGAVAGLLLNIGFSRHPIDHVQKHALGLALTWTVAHAVYGSLLGFIYGLTEGILE
ncbi:MAG: hypothetical protein KA436_00305 [Oligoflexales bacterium]|nr:hypothetical protein [Oligoflexales bacterium]